MDDVFISWSGNRSKAIAELFSEWLPCVIQSIKPWVSSRDIDRGSLWFTKLSDQLKDSTTGIICLTKSNLNEPWILFEAGALAKGLSSSKVCTFLIDLQPTDVGNPLGQFNSTQPNKPDLFNLIKTLNSSLDQKRLERVFETYWPQFESEFTDILDISEDTIEQSRTEDSLLTEMLETIRSLDKRIRSFENSNVQRVFNRNITIRRRISRKRVNEQVHSLISDGVALKDIAEELSSKAPLEFILDAYESYWCGTLESEYYSSESIDSQED